MNCRCGTPLIGRQTKFCSEACRKKASRAGTLPVERFNRDTSEIRKVLSDAVELGAVESAKRNGIARSTVYKWIEAYPDEHAGLQERYIGRQRDRAQRARLDFIVEATDAQPELLQATVEAVRAGTVKDPSVALKNVSISAGINNDHMLKTAGLATEIVEHRSVKEALRELKQVNLGDVDD